MNPAYRSAVFQVEGTLPATHFSIVTAYNPNGVLTDSASNAVADQQLLQAIQQNGESPVRITGMSPDRSHQEPGWSIEDEKEALRLAQKFFQVALYRVIEGDLFLIERETGTREKLGKWQDFVRQ